jgi:hypothetical protein
MKEKQQYPLSRKNRAQAESGTNRRSEFKVQMQPRERLELTVGKNITRIHSWCASQKIKSWKFTPIDRLRLLTLRVWEKKYYLPLPEILTVLTGYWKAFHSKRDFGNKLSFGVSIPVLVGKKSEKVLQDYIRKTYPGNEHVSVWRSAEQRFHVRLISGDSQSPEAHRSALLKLFQLKNQSWRRNPWK